MRPAAVLLDRDGVITVHRPGYITCVEELEMLPGAAAAIGRLSRAHLPVAIVTNQSMVNRGLATAAALDQVHAAMLGYIEAEGGRLQAVLSCPHRPDEGCGCRKPEPGLLLQAADLLGIAPSACLLVGDAETDMEAARRAGCAALRVGVAGLPDLAAAVDLILAS